MGNLKRKQEDGMKNIEGGKKRKSNTSQKKYQTKGLNTTSKCWLEKFLPRTLGKVLE